MTEREVEEVEAEVVEGEEDEGGTVEAGVSLTRRRPASTPIKPEPVSMVDYLDEIASEEAMEAQGRLSKAYSDYCHAILDESDQQEIEGRAFKKKSAWRKLGRAFQVSTEIIDESGWWEADPDEGVRHFVAKYVVRATAPWGQYTEAVGSCSTREDRFYSTGASCPECGGPMWDNRRAITGKDPNAPAWKRQLAAFTCRDKSCAGEIGDMDHETSRVPNRSARAKADHDVRSTAQTRATNRAISDLIAAGEVSAEEVDQGPNGSAASEEPDDAKTSLLWRNVGFGKHAAKAWGWVVKNDPEFAMKAVNEGKLEGQEADELRSVLPITQAYRDEVALLLDTRVFEDGDEKHQKMKQWCVGVASGELSPSIKKAQDAIVKIGMLESKEPEEPEPQSDDSNGDDDEFEDELPF